MAHRQVADHVQNVAAPHCIAGHHGDDGLGQAADLDLRARENPTLIFARSSPMARVHTSHLQIQDVEAGDLVLPNVAALAAHALVPSAAKSQGPFACTKGVKAGFGRYQYTMHRGG